MAITATTIDIFRGDTPTVVFTVKDSAGVAVDLTSVTEIRFMAKRNTDEADVDAIFDKVCTVTNATGGICEATLDATDTAVNGVYIADLQIKFTSGTISTALQFTVNIKADVRIAT